MARKNSKARYKNLHKATLLEEKRKAEKLAAKAAKRKEKREFLSSAMRNLVPITNKMDSSPIKVRKKIGKKRKSA